MPLLRADLHVALFQPVRGLPELRQHQMLGHVPTSQDAKAVNGPDICLLQLSSDPIRQMGFGDAGECTFWINADDLAACRFEKARGTIVATEHLQR